MIKMIDISGQKFGRLTAIKFVEIRDNYDYYWLFRCACSVEKVICKASVISKKTTSCGCYHRDKMTTHGMSETRFYRIWDGIVQRCLNPKNKRYKDYGGRNIECDWKSFEEFRDDMYNSYKEHLAKYGVKNTAIDRADNNKHYCKKNCRWATRKEQSRNTRNNHLLTYKGKTQCISAWAEELCLSRGILYYRLKMMKLTVEEAFKWQKYQKKNKLYL